MRRIKEKENIILGLPSKYSNLFENLKQYSINLLKTIKLIHIYNTRFTNENILD